MYCSDACRNKFGKPTFKKGSQVTFTCFGCGEEKTVPINYPSAKKFCSNACAKRGILKKKIGVNEGDYAIILDSTWESLFYGTCGFLKVPIRRYDGPAYEYSGGKYRPDFIVGDSVIVDVKGWMDGRSRQVQREVPGITFVDQPFLEILRKADSPEDFLSLLVSNPS